MCTLFDTANHDPVTDATDRQVDLLQSGLRDKPAEDATRNVDDAAAHLPQIFGMAPEMRIVAIEPMLAK